MPSNGPRLWEKPWTIQEIRGNANNWSLAGDAGVCLHLYHFINLKNLACLKFEIYTLYCLANIVTTDFRDKYYIYHVSYQLTNLNIRNRRMSLFTQRVRHMVYIYVL